MTPVAAPRATHIADAPRAGPSPTLRSPRALARGRSALLELARRNGEVRLRIGDGVCAPAGAADLSELLDGLNDDGLLRYGGMETATSGCELVYLPA